MIAINKGLNLRSLSMNNHQGQRKIIKEMIEFNFGKSCQTWTENKFDLYIICNVNLITDYLICWLLLNKLFICLP